MPVDPQKNDVKFFFDSLTEFVSRLTKRLLFWSKKGTAEATLAYHVGLVKLKISARQKEIESHYLALGEYIYRMKGKVESTDEIIKGHFHNIHNLENEIGNLEAKILNLHEEYASKVKKKNKQPPYPKPES